jgi:hypothetical protein
VDQSIADYIRANRDKYTREAIRDQLIAAGHDHGAIDEAWHAVEAEATGAQGPPASRVGIVAYVVIWYLFGGLFTLAGATGSGLGWFPPVYLVVGGVVAYLVTRIPVRGMGWLLAVPLVPIAFFLVWYGTCVAAYSVSH